MSSSIMGSVLSPSTVDASCCSSSTSNGWMSSGRETSVEHSVPVDAPTKGGASCTCLEIPSPGTSISSAAHVKSSRVLLSRSCSSACEPSRGCNSTSGSFVSSWRETVLELCIPCDAPTEGGASCKCFKNHVSRPLWQVSCSYCAPLGNLGCSLWGGSILWMFGVYVSMPP